MSQRLQATMSAHHAPPQATESCSLVAEAFGATYTRRVGPISEDAFLLASDLGLYAVADGIGGPGLGDVAAHWVLRSVLAALEAPDTPWAPGPCGAAAETGARIVVAGLQCAHRRIQSAARGDASKRAMATTFAGLLLTKEHVVVANVGDARVYRLRGTQLTALTVDHSVTSELLRRGVLAQEDVATFPFGHVLCRAVGSKGPLSVDIRVERAAFGDVYLACTREVHRVVDELDVAATLRTHEDPAAAIAALLRSASKRGTPGSATAVAVRVRSPRNTAKEVALVRA